MNEIAESSDDVEPFCEDYGLYLKQYARVNITICLPQLKQPGQSISNWDLMERLKKAVQPVKLSSIRVSTSTIELVRFEAELPCRKILSKVIKALDGYSLKVAGFIEPLKVRAAEAKSDFPTRHDWDNYFLNAKNMDEKKAGLRPDTVYLAKVPSNWFKEPDSSLSSDLPNPAVLQKVFEQFGKVRCVDIPICDPYRKYMPSSVSGMRNAGFSFGQEVLFEGYVQFVEYISFMRAMDTLRNMKLVKLMRDGRKFEASIKVDFDKHGHLSENNIRLREEARERLRKEEQAKLENEARKRKETEGKETEYKKVEREEKRKQKKLQEKSSDDEEKRQELLEAKRRKELNARRKLSSRRLLLALFDRIAEKKRKQKKLKIAKEKEDRESSPVIDILADNDGISNDLEHRLRQALLKEQELRIRRRIEAKLLLRENSAPSKSGRKRKSHDDHSKD
ncbi:hypothetical protein AB6A40_003660 [Gnathostoma spinigerum]|uniref:A-kinase anchor protein 17A n=1 Tax=Gnathostoma spinigerum TaxID=75299 RepID=A0ABD6ECM5_9BILA